MANLNPSQRYAYGMSFVPDESLKNSPYGTVPVPTRTGGINIPGAPNQQSYGKNPFVLYAPGNEQYNVVPTNTASVQESTMSTLGWVALALGGLALYYIVK